MFVSSNLIFLRTRDNKSQNQIADLIKIGRGSYSQYERGRSMPPMETLLNLADYFKVGLDTLVRKNLASINQIQLDDIFNSHSKTARGVNLRILPISVGTDNLDNVEFVPKKAKAGYIGGGHEDAVFISELVQFRLPMLPSNRKFRMFQIEGDSMHPIPDGAYVLGSHVQNWFSIKEKKPYIIITKEDIVFKTVTAKPLETAPEPFLTLTSLNKQYSPYNLRLEEVLEMWEFTLFMSSDIPESVPDIPFLEILNEIRSLKRGFFTQNPDNT